MRPLRLMLTAFGPYKDKEVIDFRNLEDNQLLFVISGHTGSGKTTIFDGISFALYGSASGEDRERDMLRSDFADDDVHTAVELLFELNGRTYRILRQPGHIKRGNRSRTGENYEFFERTDDGEVPVVDRQIVTEINRKVEELIGLTQNQFKQIVMLPQGEFRKLLTSDTDNKEEILRQLFKTDSYTDMESRLKERRDVLQQDFNKIQQLRDHYIQQIHGTLIEREESELFQVLREEHYNINQVLDGLEKEIDFYTNEIGLAEHTYKIARDAYEKTHANFHEAKTVNENFKQLNDKKQKLAQLTEQKSLQTEREQRLSHAERANEIEPVEAKLTERRENEATRKKVTLHILNQEKTVLNQLLEAKKVYEQEEKNEQLRNDTRKKLEELQNLSPDVEALNDNRQLVERQKKKVLEYENLVKQIELQMSEIVKKRDMEKKVIDTHEQAVSTYIDKFTALTKLREKYKHLETYKTCSETHLAILKEVKEKKKQCDLAEKQYVELEKVWLNDQAVLLAGQLHDGDSCPVCGSAEHPKKATHEVEGVTKEELDRLKENYDKKQKIYSELSYSLKEQESKLKEAHKNVSMYDVQLETISEVIEQVCEDGKKLGQEVKEIEAKQKRLNDLRSNYNKLEDTIKKIETNLESVKENGQKERDRLTEARTRYEERLKRIPEQMRDLTVLKHTLNETKKQYERLDQAWKTAEWNLQNANHAQIKIKSELQSAKAELAEATEKRIEAEEAFSKAVQTGKFTSIEAYKKAQLSKQDQATLKKEIEQFNIAMTMLTKEVSDLEERLKDKVIVDLTEMEATLKKVREESETAFNKLKDMQKHAEEAKGLKSSIKTEHEKVKQFEKKLSIVTDLYDVIRGQNEPRISFERYIQIGYLEQIIDAANERLKHLSNGQFLLMRSERQETHGRQSGLALDVYDAYTGQTRDVKSLSGGEKFNTSLCLALGMSDVIQSFQGGISIETMFIDEGFGSLDEESLNKAIDTLIDLQQSGRMIGVISHVEQLKTIFPAVLQVKKLKEGYSETEFIIR